MNFILFHYDDDDDDDPYKDSYIMICLILCYSSSINGKVIKHSLKSLGVCFLSIIVDIEY